MRNSCFKLFQLPPSISSYLSFFIKVEGVFEGGRMQTEEKVDKIINLIEKFINYDDSPSRFFKPKKELSFSRKEIKQLIDEITSYYGINENNLDILDDEITFVISSKHDSENGDYEILTEARLKFKKENGSLKLTGIELVKSINQLY